MRVLTTVSHGDWFNAWGSWGRPSVDRILDEIAAAGVVDVPWRTMFGGRAQYASQLEDVYWGSENGTGIDRPGNEGSSRRSYDLRAWDPLADAVHAARDRGLRIGAWYPLVEESHFQLDVSRYAREHPEAWATDADGRTRRSKLSLADPGVIEHKLAMIAEQLDYGVDFVMLDFYRETQEWELRRVPSVEVDSSGVSLFGFDAATRAVALAADIDPDRVPNDDLAWVDLRVGITTSFVRRAAALVHGRGARLGVRVRSLRAMRLPIPWWEPEAHDTDARRGSFVDWAAWSREGLVDEVVLFMDNWDLFDLTAERVWEEARDARRRLAETTELLVGIFVFDMLGTPVERAAAHLETLGDSAVRGGADGVCLLESNNVHAWGGGIGGGGREIGLWDAVHRMSDPAWGGRHI